MSRLNLSLRPAIIGNQIRANAEMHGEDSESGLYVPIKGVMITRDELNTLAQDETFWARRFDGTPDKLYAVLDYKDFDTEIKFKHKLEGAKVRFVYGADNFEVEFTACRLAKIRLQPIEGGMCELSFELQTVPTLDESVADFLGQLNQQVQVEISSAALSAKDAQQNLPLNQPASEPPKDATRIVGDSDSEAERTDTERQLGEALRGLDTDKAA